jgi:hypothetical protein
MNTPLNTLPIEDFLNKARIAIKSNQKNLTLTIREVTDLQNSLALVMTRLANGPETSSQETITIKMDGGGFTSF